MPPRELALLARAPRPETIDGVVARLHAIEAALPEQNGIKTFNRLYRWTTENVGLAVKQERFQKCNAMEALDVRFACLYFDAVDAWAEARAVPGAWQPLFDHAENPEVGSLRFALAGMNTHISRDLAVAVAESQDERPDEDSAEYLDYVLVNQVLEATSDQVRGRILPATLTEIDTALGEADAALIIGAMATARKAAWEGAQVLWHLRPTEVLYRRALQGLDFVVGTTSRVILFDPDLPSFGGLRERLEAKLGEHEA